MAAALPSLIVLKSYYQSDKGYANYKSDNSVVLGEDDVFSTLAKIALEPATSDSRYVNLRFAYSNGYWARDANDTFIVAASKQADEDITKTSCTLFEPMNVDATNQVFYLKHVQSGGRLAVNNDSAAFYVDDTSGSVDANLIYADWESFVKLPAHVAFKGDNGMYLLTGFWDNAHLLQFSSSDPNQTASGYQVSQRPDGSVQITTDLSGQTWWSGKWNEQPSDSWVYSDWSDKWDSESAIFTPVKIDDSTIALRSHGPYATNTFCCRLTSGQRTSCLAPATATITTVARLVVQELVLTRTVYDAVYDMDSARIYNETPFVAGSTVLINDTDEEASMEVDITYQNEISCTFSRSSSMSAGVTTTFEVGVPLIESTEIQISFDINKTLEWGSTKTTTTSVTASGTVPVPARSSATIQYVGTTGTCDVPYTYTQKDVRSTDGQIVYSTQTDGIYTGVNSYNFNFQVASTQPLAAA